MTTRKGKIARLPFNIREEINHQLADNLPAKDILHWLNSHSTVRYYMERLFQGRYITEQNLSEWRQGGHQEWLTYHSTIETVRDLSEDAVRAALTDISAEHLLLALTASFAAMIKKQDQTPEIPFNRKLIVMQHLIKTALSLRRSEQRDERLKIDRERLEILRSRKGNKSPSSIPPLPDETRASSFSSARPPTPAHPLHPKAPAIRRPPPGIDPSHYPDEPNWPSAPAEFPHGDPSPEAASATSDAPDFAAVATPADPTPGNCEPGVPTPETSNWLD